MDPNNNQPINTNPLSQPVQPIQPPVQPQIEQQPVTQPLQQTQTVSAPPPPAAPAAAVAAPMPEAPKNGSKKGIILILILLILVLGMGYYVFFAKQQLSNIQKKSTDNTSVAIPTATIAPTAAPATADEISVESPEADLIEIENDLQGL